MLARIVALIVLFCFIMQWNDNTKWRGYLPDTAKLIDTAKEKAAKAKDTIVDKAEKTGEWIKDKYDEKRDVDTAALGKITHERNEARRHLKEL